MATDGSTDRLPRDPWLTLVIVLGRHKRRPLVELCSCSRPDARVRWTEEHVADAALAAGVVPPRQDAAS